MRHILPGLFVFATIGFTSAQQIKSEKVIDSTAVWGTGEVTLADSRQVSGRLRYNKITGLLNFDAGSDPKSFTPAGVLAFTFYDSLQQKQRRFISYAFDNFKPAMDSIARAKGVSAVKIKPKFFEVLMEFESFAVLCMTGPLSISTSNGSLGNYSFVLGVWNLANAKQPATTYSYLEQLYIFDKDGAVTPLLMIFNRDKDGMLFDMNQTMRFGRFAARVMERYTSPHFQQVDDYARARKLSYEKKQDILKLFEYYNTLVTR